MTAPRRLQLRRGNSTAISSYTGAAGELVVNTTNWSLRLHDGSTVGGYVVGGGGGTLYSDSNVFSYLTNTSTTLTSLRVTTAAIAQINGTNPGSELVIQTGGLNNFNFRSSGNLEVPGSIIPTANVAYSLGNITHQWRDLFVSNNTIFVGGVPLGIDVTGNLTINGTVIPTISYVNTVVANVVVDLSAYALNANVTAANVGLKGYVDSQSFYSNTKVASYLPTYSGNIAANISKAGYTWTFGTDGNLRFPDGTSYTGSELVSATVPTIGGTASAGEAGITYLSGDLSKWAIFTEGAFTVGVWTDVQPGWTVTDNNGFTDTIAGRGSFGAASFQTTVNSWPAPASGKTYVFTSPDYQLGYTNPIEITVGNNNWRFGTDGRLTFPDNTVQQTAFSNTASIITTIIANAATQSDLIIDINANVTAANLGMRGYVDSQNFYSNAKVATYLQVGGISNVSVAGNVTATYFIGNGALLTGIAVSSSYSNVQVATYLPTYTGTLAGETLNLAGQDGTTVVDFQTGAATNQIITLGSNYTFSIKAGAAASNRGSLVLESGQNSRVRINGNGSNVLITAGNGTQSSTWTFANSGVLTFPDGTTQSTAAGGGGSNYGNVNVKAYTESMGFTNYSNVNVASYLSTATINTTGNITAQNISGNISITGNVTGTSSNVTLQAGSYSSIFDNQGNVTVPRLFTAGNIQTAGYLFGNGALLTGIVAGSSYSNVQVATYLPTYSGVVGASNVFVSGNVTAQYFLGNGALLTGIASSYSNVQVATYLPTYTGNVANVRLGTSGILTFPDGSQQTTAAFGGGGNYGNANVAAFLPTYTGTTGITQIGTLATLSVSGNATVGNLVGTEANTRIIANVYTTTFDIYGNVSFPGNITTSSSGYFVGNALGTTAAYTGNVTVGGNLTIIGTKSNVPVKTGGFVAQNTAVSIDSITAQWLNTGGPSANQLQLAALNGNVSILYTYTFQDGTGGSTTGGSSSTTLANLSFGWTSIGNPSGVAGDMYNVLVSLPGTNAYRITAMTGSGYSDNVLTVERLI
jgi:hypothetical protein